MKNLITGFLKDEDGVGVIEIVIILAALVAIALIFKNQIKALFTKLWKGATDNVEFDVNNEVDTYTVPESNKSNG